jgi:erythromycin esterase-like protein
LCTAAAPVTGAADDYDDLLASIGNARFVALGEDTHGTHEFYRERARITERLVRDMHFRAVIIEADWPDTDRINRYVRGEGQDRSAAQALGVYRDFPQWMWRNAEFRDLVESLRAYNQTLPAEDRVGIYGMDIYNLFGAIEAVRRYAQEQDRELAERVQEEYRCFARYREDPQAYGAAARRRSNSCTDEAQAVLDLVSAHVHAENLGAHENHFSAVRSAASVAGAEEYHRESFSGSNSWNVRDRRMVANIVDIARHIGSGTGTPGKVVIWAHNSHVGDARATDAMLRGELNVGQLLRERLGEAAYLVGLLTYRGRVVAADEWGSRGVEQDLRPALPESYSGMLAAAGLSNALLLFGDASAGELAGDPLLERAVGVIYRPRSERLSHYFTADLPQQFDAVLFFRESTAVTPL